MLHSGALKVVGPTVADRSSRCPKAGKLNGMNNTKNGMRFSHLLRI